MGRDLATLTELTSIAPPIRPRCSRPPRYLAQRPAAIQQAEVQVLLDIVQATGGSSMANNVPRSPSCCLSSSARTRNAAGTARSRVTPNRHPSRLSCSTASSGSWYWPLTTKARGREIGHLPQRLAAGRNEVDYDLALSKLLDELVRPRRSRAHFGTRVDHRRPHPRARFRGSPAPSREAACRCRSPLGWKGRRSDRSFGGCRSPLR